MDKEDMYIKEAKPRRNCTVALISLYSSDAIGLRYISSFLRKNGFNPILIFFKEKYLAFDLMELPTQKEYEILIGVLRDINPNIVGMGMRSSFLKIGTAITKNIKEKLNIPVVWGGIHPTVAPEQSIQIADMICIGEGEFPMVEVAQKISQGEDLSDIENMWMKKNGHVTRNPVRPLNQDLDALPYPDYGNGNEYFIEKGKLTIEDPGIQAFNLDILASRGCPYNCSYCSNSILEKIYKGKGPIVRRRSVDNIIEEIKYGRPKFPRLRRIDFIDEVFAWDKEWTQEFIERYKKEVAVPFHCMQHPKITDKGILSLLKKAGLERVEVGIQSSSENIRKNIFHRRVTDQELIETSKTLSELKIIPFYDIIIDNPFETEEDKRRGLDLLLKLSRPFYLHMFSLIYFPNTVLTNRALEKKLIDESQIEGNAERTFDQMFVSLNHQRPVHDQFWASLYSLTSKNFVPRAFIRFLSKSKFLLEKPRVLVSLADFCNNLKLATIAVKWLFQGRPVFESIKVRSKRKSSPII